MCHVLAQTSNLKPRARAAWEAAGGDRAADAEGCGLALYVIVNGPARETSVAHALAYARGEIADGIGEAGATIGDGTHVQITMRER